MSTDRSTFIGAYAVGSFHGEEKKTVTWYCPNGHDLIRPDLYCPTCGRHVLPRVESGYIVPDVYPMLNFNFRHEPLRGITEPMSEPGLFRMIVYSNLTNCSSHLPEISNETEGGSLAPISSETITWCISVFKELFYKELEILHTKSDDLCVEFGAITNWM